MVASYDYNVLRPVIFEIADAFLKGRVAPGSLVLLKPNLLAPARPDTAILTHPHVVRAVAEYVLQQGARVVVSDSNAMGRFEKVVEESGLGKALRGLDVKITEFRDSREVDVGEPFKKIEVAGEALNADLVINLAKLKTHSQMVMTLGIKNLFGCVVGLRKPEWHFRTGVNRELFAMLLVKIHEAIKPALTIIDGIIAMEGDGPGRSGTPRELGVIAASDNTYALDLSVCKMIGMDPGNVLTNRAAEQMGLMPSHIDIMGEMPRIKDFRLPEIGPLVFGPRSLHGLMRRHFVQRPAADNSLCRLCGECWKYCPVKAIKPAKGRLLVDYEKCVRCYCCVEVCPRGAMRTREPLVGKILRKLRK